MFKGARAYDSMRNEKKLRRSASRVRLECRWMHRSCQPHRSLASFVSGFWPSGQSLANAKLSAAWRGVDYPTFPAMTDHALFELIQPRDIRMVFSKIITAAENRRVWQADLDLALRDNSTECEAGSSPLT